MNLLRLIEFLRSRRQTVIYVCLGVLALVALIDAIPALVDKHDAHTKIEHLPAFWSVYGFVACVLIVLVSKAFGKAGIMTRENYYDE
ncbi:MAG: hypothetical protein PHQ04_10735 [Opitutaceae bacterium]|nr:hypothetical protein [Opitutaceae bacterium]